MRWSPRALAAAAVAPTTLLMAACTSAPGQPPAPAPAVATSPGAVPPGATTLPHAAGPAAGPGSRAGGTVRFSSYSDNDGPASTAVLTGAIGDYGKAVSVHPDGTIDPGHTSQLELELSQGTFRITVGPLDHKLVAAFRTFPPDLATCSGVVRATAAAPVVAGSGTGRYRGISGSFQLTVTVSEVDGAQRCSPASAFLAQNVFITGPGRVSFR
ncbi:MAG TPA: hypothetical protein VH641_03740 [Streptosporangiaceae bacterium]